MKISISNNTYRDFPVTSYNITLICGNSHEGKPFQKYIQLNFFFDWNFYRLFEWNISFLISESYPTIGQEIKFQKVVISEKYAAAKQNKLIKTA